jgi:hypothetical protein
MTLFKKKDSMHHWIDVGDIGCPLYICKYCGEDVLDHVPIPGPCSVTFNGYDRVPLISFNYRDNV